MYALAIGLSIGAAATVARRDLEPAAPSARTSASTST
jgi:hypothetical protein